MSEIEQILFACAPWFEHFDLLQLFEEQQVPANFAIWFFLRTVGISFVQRNSFFQTGL